MGMKQAAEQQERLAEQLRAKHLRIMKARKKFTEVFGVDVKKFYDNIFIGFDVIGFDDYLREKVEAYDEDKESMSDFLIRRFGDEANKMVKSFI